ncbi:MAG: L-serine ammonia-lyase, iron-sulfur-dependent, subunit alpha [Saccharofermentanales bacterium]|jgi:L-serine dehydratase
MERYADVIQTCTETHQTLARYFLEREVAMGELDEATILDKMARQLHVMEQAANEGLEGVQSFSGLSGGDAPRLAHYRDNDPPMGGSLYLDAMTLAIAVNEVNASMGLICATPTAGSSGIVPAVLLAYAGRHEVDERQKIDFLLTCGGVGLLIGNMASLSGAAGGCQAEVGSASAMTAAALVELVGGTPAMSGHATAIALKNLLGLTCDPVATLVEVPCIKRNAIGAVNAISAAEMALAGMESRIPVDEVIGAMGSIGRMMPVALRETAMGGLAQTPTAIAMTEMLQKDGHIDRAKLSD